MTIAAADDTSRGAGVVTNYTVRRARRALSRRTRSGCRTATPITTWNAVVRALPTSATLQRSTAARAVTVSTGCTRRPRRTNAGRPARSPRCAASAQNTGLIGGYIKIEIQKADDRWQDVTAEILNYGIRRPRNQAGAICDDPTPNAIIRLQRLRDNGGTCHYSKDGTNGARSARTRTTTGRNMLFDAREGLLRDAALADATSDARRRDALRRARRRQPVELVQVRGAVRWRVQRQPGCYYEQRLQRVLLGSPNNRADRPQRPRRGQSNLESGEYGFEDVVNPLERRRHAERRRSTAAKTSTPTACSTPTASIPSFLGVREHAAAREAWQPVCRHDAANIRPDETGWTVRGRWSTAPTCSGAR